MRNGLTAFGFEHWPRRSKERLFVGIPVAAHQETWETIERTLDCLRAQTVNPRDFRIFIFLNSPDTQFHCNQFEVTRERITEYQKSNPNFPLSVMEGSFPDGSTIGLIRKTLWDSIIDWVEASRNAYKGKLPKNIYGVNTDIDSPYISKHFLQGYLEEFDEDEKVQIVSAKLFWAKPFPELTDIHLSARMLSNGTGDERSAQEFAAYIVNRYITFLNRVHKVYEKIKKVNHVYEATLGFRLRKYVEVGGVNPESETSEFMDLYKKIQEDVDGRGWVKRPNRGFIISDSRRLISAISKGIPQRECWDTSKHSFTQSDLLRNPEYLHHLIYGAALNIVRNLDCLALETLGPDILLDSDLILATEMCMSWFSHKDRALIASLKDFLTEVEGTYNHWHSIGADDKELRKAIEEDVPIWIEVACMNMYEGTRGLVFSDPRNGQRIIRESAGRDFFPEFDRCGVYSCAGAK